MTEKQAIVANHLQMAATQAMRDLAVLARLYLRSVTGQDFEVFIRLPQDSSITATRIMEDRVDG